MGAGLEVVSGFATAPGTTWTAWTMASGNSSQVRSAAIGTVIKLVNAWAFNNSAGALRVRSPRLHDVNQGIYMRVPAALSIPKYPNFFTSGFGQPLVPQDTLIIEQTGSSTAGQIETGTLLLYYANLPGVAGRFINTSQLAQYGLNLMGQQLSITTGTTGGYSGQVAVNSQVDNWKANTDYALVGGYVDTRAGTVRIQGVDVGNLGVGFPADPTIGEETATWFATLSDTTGLALIPVFNSANKFNILVDVTGNQAAITTNMSLFFVELQAGSVPGATQPGTTG